MVDIDKVWLRKRIMEEACKLFAVTREEVMGRYGQRKVNEARKAYVYLCRTRLKDTHQRIGIELNRPLNAVVMTYQAAEELMSVRVDPYHFRQSVEWIESRIFYSKLINNHGQQDQKTGSRTDAQLCANHGKQA